jgi:hypothetical protein
MIRKGRKDGMGKKGGNSRSGTNARGVGVLMLLLVCLLLWSWPSFAHHALSEYESARVATIEGTLSEIRIKNPHSTLIIQASGGAGTADRWAVEWLAALVLKHEGVENTTLKPGDRLIITGNPSRDPGARRLWLRTVTRPADGWTWTGGF